jgi:hypothetical protein
MGFRNPVTTVSTAATAGRVDTRPDPASRGVVLDNSVTTIGGRAGAGLVWSSGVSGGGADALAVDVVQGSAVGILGRFLRFLAGSVPAYTGTIPYLDLQTTALAAQTGAPVNKSSATLSADTITLQGAVNGADPAFIAPTLQNSWTDYNYVAGNTATFGPTGYQKLSDGSVLVSMMVKGGTIGVGVPVFTLPAGYRRSVKPPPIPALGNNAVARVDLETDGRVCVVVGSTLWTAALFVFVPDS